MKVANTGIKQLNRINMPKYTYRNISNIFFHAVPAFGSISKETKFPSMEVSITQIAVLVQWTWSYFCGPTQKHLALKQPLNHREFGFSLQDVMLLKLSLGPHF